MSILTKATVLVLNRNWQAINVRTPQEAEGSGLLTVPVVHRGPASLDQLRSLIGPSAFGSQFENPTTGGVDNLMEGLYCRTEANGYVSGRAKMVRTEFVEKVKQSEHWQHHAIQ